MVRFLSVFIALACTSAHASQGVVLLPNATINFPIANQIPFSVVNSYRIEFRIHAWTQPTGITNIVSFPGLQARFTGTSYGCSLIVTDWIDTFAPGAGNDLCFNFSGISDLVVRMQRDTSANVFSAQIWNANGAGPISTLTLSFSSAGTQQFPSQVYIGDTAANGVLDDLRWFSTTAAANASPFTNAPGDLADCEFEGTLADSSPQNLTLASSAPTAFAASPIYAPLASQGLQRVFNAGLPATLDGSGSTPLNGVGSLSYLWTQVSGPTQLQWSSTSAVKPTITGLVFGPYQIELTVTDSTGQSSSNTLKYGSVFTNANDVVIPPQGYVTAILGPMLRLGANPWPYFDTSQQAMADYFGGLQSTLYQATWNVAQPGTISVTNGSTTITGSGTAFLAEFCGGGGTGVNGAAVIVGYPVPGQSGQSGRVPYTVASCLSDTSLTITQPYAVSPSANGLSFAAMNNTTIGTWINGSSNANYYDNVMAFYNLYYRSGIDDYLNYARNLADLWYTMPWFDQGRAALNGSTTLFPRLQSLTGLVLRAFDGQPGYWTGIEQYLNFDYTFANATPIGGFALNDIREQGYATAFLALGALYDPTPANQSLYAGELETVLSNVWVPAMQPAGNWENITYGYATWNGNGGTVNVTSGSTIVNGTGTSWQPEWFTGNSFWTANLDGATNGDSIAYTATVISPTQLALNVPYQGHTGTGRGWETNSLVGTGTQPFMMGVVGNSFQWSYLATGDARLPGMLNNVQNWLSTQGYRPDARGLWYGRVFPNCEPIAITNANCSGGTVEQSRFLAGETVGALSSAYLLSGNPALAAFGDNLYGAMFGGPTGGPDSDSTYVNDIAPGGWAMQNNLAKDFGFFFGFGGGASWPAARLGAAAQPAPVGCAYTLAQSTAAVASGGGPGTLNLITSGIGCSWTATSNSSWITITSAASGTGTATIGYTVAANAGPGSRSGAITVGGQTLSISEAGPLCTFAVTPATALIGGAGATGTVTVAASAGSCPWTAVSNAAFIGITSGASGTGNGTVTYSVQPNNNGVVRIGTLTVTGTTVALTQSPSGGVLSNIGTPPISGSVSVNNGVYVVTGAGFGLWSTADQFTFNHWGTAGDATITARLTSVANASSLTKAGVMIRQSLAPNSANGSALMLPTALAAQYRATAGASTTYVGSTPPVLPVWLRASLSNGVVTTSTSPDGVNWSQIGKPQAVPMTMPFLGLAVTSQNVLLPATATFDNVTISQP